MKEKIKIFLCNLKEVILPHFIAIDEENSNFIRYPGIGIFKVIDKYTNLFHKDFYKNWRYTYECDNIRFIKHKKNKKKGNLHGYKNK